ncbi:fibronectin type III domain-containing protein, partial [Hornefia butyriciproducens]|uniref:fibronectin type III domain-containing protein n=1 Tax=Hornefia butyriciproducens TaxID=2652293 RepID=UPI003D05C87D
NNINLGNGRVIITKTKYSVGEERTLGFNIIHPNNHDYDSKWTIVKEATCTENGSKYRKCTICDATTDVTKIEKLGHDFGGWTEIQSSSCVDMGSEQRVCKRCQLTETRDVQASGHTWDDDYTIDQEATCIEDGSKSIHCQKCEAVKDSQVIPALGHDYVEHEAKAATCTEKGHKAYQTCSRCDYTTYEEIPATVHSFTEYTSNDDATCTSDGTETSICDNGCGITDTRTEKDTALGHDFGEWTEIQSSSCVDKGSEQRICKRCQLTETRDVQASGHTWDDDYTIDQEATCTEDGSKSIHCQKCKAVKDSQVIPALCHKYEYEITKATTSKNGSIETKCSVCGDMTSSTAIYYPKSLKLSTTNYNYSGGVKTPAVSVIDAYGNAVSSSNYSVSYASGRKSVGSYKVTVTFKGDKYSGSKYTYFYINPKGTSIAKVSGAKKAFNVKWKKQSSKMTTTTITGYQIRYSTSSKMTSPKYKTVKGYKSTSKKITKLSAKKKYYVQVRTYKTVSGKTYYSSWSSVKSVKTK